MKLRRIITMCAAFAVTLFSTTSCLVGRYMCNYSLDPGRNSLERNREKSDRLTPGTVKWFDDLHDAGIMKDTVIIGENGYKIHANYIAAKDPATAKGTAIVIHGYGDDIMVFMNIGRMYRDELNYNLLAPDLQYHGESEGRAIQMGWLDRLDIIRWIDVAHNIFNDDFMVIHGVSMGGATTMMVSGEDLPPYVRAFVDDCGYSSVWDQFAHNLKDSFHLPAFPVLNSASIVCKNRYGWTFKEASSVNQLAKCNRPMLFIHGDSDDFVPTAHVYKNYDAKVNGYKDLWLVPDTKHAMASRNYPEEYCKRVGEFLEKVKTF